MNLDRFSGAGSTPSRRRFWDKVQEAVMASRKVEGRHVKIDEHPGAGSVINVDDTSTRRPTDGSAGACCYDDGTCDDLIESECTDAGGNWQGPGTTCDDDPPPCVGVCCEESGCVDDSTPDSCEADGGTWTDFGTTCDDDPPPCDTGACCAEDGSCSITTEEDCTGVYQGGGTTCDPNPCTPPSCDCGFPEFIETDPTLRYLTKTYTYERTASSSVGHPTCDTTMSFTTIKTWTIAEDGSCSMDSSCSGSVMLDEEGEDPCNQDWVYDATNAHNDDFGYAGGCHEAGGGCHACAPSNCETVALTPSSSTVESGTCGVSSPPGILAHLEYTATLSNPFHCADGFSPPP